MRCVNHVLAALLAGAAFEASNDIAGINLAEPVLKRETGLKPQRYWLELFARGESLKRVKIVTGYGAHLPGLVQREPAFDGRAAFIFVECFQIEIFAGVAVHHHAPGITREGGLMNDKCRCGTFLG